MMFSSRSFDASRRLLRRAGLILIAFVLGQGTGLWLPGGPVLAVAAPTGIANLPSDPLVRARMLVRRGDAKGALALLDPALQDPATAEEARLIALEAAVLSGRSDLVQHLPARYRPRQLRHPRSASSTRRRFSLRHLVVLMPKTASSPKSPRIRRSFSA